MTHQTSFSQAEFADKKKITRREKFLGRMLLDGQYDNALFCMSYEKKSGSGGARKNGQGVPKAFQHGRTGQAQGENDRA